MHSIAVLLSVGTNPQPGIVSNQCLPSTHLTVVTLKVNMCISVGVCKMRMQSINCMYMIVCVCVLRGGQLIMSSHGLQRSYLS